MIPESYYQLRPYPLSDEECDRFRRMPLKFNDMVRVIFAAGAQQVLESVATVNEVQRMVFELGYEKGKADAEK